MRYFLSLIFLCSCILNGYAQPANDECVGLIDLGIVPFCPDDEFFSNVDATESDIGIDNFPTGCDNGDIAFVGRDVWFQFTTDAITVDYTITCTGITDGMGSTAMVNPQVSVYRGDCSFDNLSLVSCGTSLDGNSELAVDLIGLDPNTPYFIRINDWSASATPNWGTFQLCIAGLDPVYIMGEDTDASSCEGTLYDSGGETGDYSNGENNTFTICPNEFHECILIDVLSFNTETNFDYVNFYEGEDINGTLIASLNGGGSGDPFEIEVSTNCVTVQFTSDGSGTNEGFELTWECTTAPCEGSSIDNPTVIGGVPYSEDDLTTCGEAATIAETPCNDSPFLNGPDYVFTYESPGDICVSVTISGANTGTGVLILDGPPGDPGTTCVATSAGGVIGSANMETPGTYYIIVANAAGCTEFDIDIAVADCTLSPALVDALCNPLNGCAQADTSGAILPSILFFEDGFQDIGNNIGVNNGCWGGVGAEADYYWFTIEAQADGPFGFILESADNPSDIDFNVWGPFSDTQVCDSSASVIDTIETTQPIRSSYAGGADPTGLADIHPVTGLPVLDEFDCFIDPQGNQDDFVTTIAASTGEHYVILVNDWGNQIQSGGIQIDWSPSNPAVLDPALQDNIPGADTTVCAGQSVQLQLPNWINDIEWIDPSGTLSCDDCNDPISSPTVTTVYQAFVSGICLNDTVNVTVNVYTLEAGDDITVCLNEDVVLSPGLVFSDVDYVWSGPNLSCTNCPEPIVTTAVPGVYTYFVEQTTPFCILLDTIELTVLTDPAPMFDVSPNTAICFGDPVELGAATNDPGLTYSWTSNPVGLISDLPNPTAFPTENTTFYVTIMSNTCPVQSMDSVFIEVNTIPIIAVANDMMVCQGDIISLGNTTEEPGVVYSWTPDTDLDDATSANPTLTANVTETYILTAVNGVCTIMDTVDVTASIISIEIDNDPDSITICKGEEVTLTTTAQPMGIVVDWTTDNGSFMGSGDDITVAPDIITEYYAEVNIPGCVRVDTFLIDVDSIPLNLDIMPSDTTVCAGLPVILSTLPYQQGDFPDIDFLWTPQNGQESPDSLLNMVISVGVTTTYIRTTTNGVCVQMDTAVVNIQPTTEIFIDPPEAAICVGESIDLLATSPDVTEFTWEPEDPEIISCTECPDPTATPNSTTTYTVSGEFGDCPIEASITIEVAAEPTLDVISDTGICPGESIVLNGFTDPNPNSVYTWTSTPGTFTSNDPMPSVSPTETTTYSVTIDNGACPPLTDQVTIELLQPASVDAGPDVFICQWQALTLEAIGNTNDGDYTWSTGETTSSIDPDTGGSGEFTYTVTFDNGCGDPATDEVVVTVYPGISITGFIFNPDEDEYIEGQVVQVTVETPPNSPTNLTYEWNFGGITIGGNQNTVNVPLVSDGLELMVTITTVDGCTNTYSEVIDVLEARFEIPNAFTPDADGINDYFNIISSLEGFMDIQAFQVFNRWGQRVYDNDTPDQGWDGTFKGKPAPSDVYIFRIEYMRPSRIIEEFTGDVTLIR